MSLQITKITVTLSVKKNYYQKGIVYPRIGAEIEQDVYKLIKIKIKWKKGK